MRIGKRNISAVALAGAFSLLAAGAEAQTAPQPVVVPLMQKDLPDMPGKEMLMLSVEYPAGTVEHVHRHDASAFVYVLEFGQLIAAGTPSAVRSSEAVQEAYLGRRHNVPSA